MEIIHRRGMYHTWEVDTGVGGRETYMVSFPRLLKLVSCPVDGGPTKAYMPGRIKKKICTGTGRPKW